MPWDRQTAPTATQDDGVSTRDYYSRHQRDNNRDSRDSQRMRIERLGITQQNTHSRNDSGNTGSADFEQQSQPRKHDYDLHAMETTVPNSSLKDSRSSIPSPSVTVRSEFPTLTRSRQQQSLACLVTVEVPEGKWQAPYEDLQNAPPVPPLPSDPSVARNNHSARESPRQPVPYESPEVLEEITEELRIRVDNWHGLEFQRCDQIILRPLFIVANWTGSAIFAFMVSYELGKTVSHGRSSSAICLAKCSSA